MTPAIFDISVDSTVNMASVNDIIIWVFHSYLNDFHDTIRTYYKL